MDAGGRVGKLINHQRACAVRVTVVGFVINPQCTYAARFTFVILSVKRHLTSRMSIRAISECAYSVAYERQNICGDLPETTAFKSYAAKHERKSQFAN